MTECTIVPKVPTQAMLDANGSSIAPQWKAWLEQDARETWAAMLAAAPPDTLRAELDEVVRQWKWCAVREDENGEPYESDGSSTRLMLCAGELQAIIAKHWRGMT